jgi:putative membrane protein
MKKLLVLASLFLTALFIVSCGPYGPMHRWEDDSMMNYGFGYGGMFMWLIFLIVLGVAIYFIVQALKDKKTGGDVKETPLNILKRRYANGEITKEEFDRMKKDLE